MNVALAFALARRPLSRGPVSYLGTRSPRALTGRATRGADRAATATNTYYDISKDTV
jgi:hypothetical protein